MSVSQCKAYYESKGQHVIAGVFIPSSDDYVLNKLKEEHIPLHHRVSMCKTIAEDYPWLGVYEPGAINLAVFAFSSLVTTFFSSLIKHLIFSCSRPSPLVAASLHL